MNRKNHSAYGLLASLCSLLFLTGAQAVAAPGTDLRDTEALRDVPLAKGVFMIDAKEPSRMAHVLKVIAETHEGIGK